VRERLSANVSLKREKKTEISLKRGVSTLRVGRVTTSASRAQKVEDGTSSLFARKHTARKLEGLPFRAAIGDRQAVYWWLLGHELSFQGKNKFSHFRQKKEKKPWI
jgi:hypothetical protein